MITESLFYLKLSIEQVLQLHLYSLHYSILSVIFPLHCAFNLITFLVLLHFFGKCGMFLQFFSTWLFFIFFYCYWNLKAVNLFANNIVVH